MQHTVKDHYKELEFSRIPPEAGCWRKVLALGQRMKFLKGEDIHPPAIDWDILFFLDRGEAWMMRPSLDGREKIVWAAGPDSLFGEVPFFNGLPTAGIVRAATDCTVYGFSRPCVLEKILPNYRDLNLALLRSLAMKSRVLINQIASLSLDDLSGRICKYLHLRQIRDAETPGETGPLVVNPGLNQQDLANLLGAHRVTLNKSLRELEKAGVLGPYSRDEVYILDKRRFQELIG